MEVPSILRRPGRRRPQGPAASSAPRRYLRGAPPPRWHAWRPLVWLGAAGIAALAVSSLLGENGWRTWRALQRERAAVDAEVSQLSARRGELENRIAALRVDPAVLERVAREKYGMHRPGEQIIELVGDELLQGQLPVPPPGRHGKIGAPKEAAPAKRSP